MLQTLGIRHYGPVCDVLEAGLYIADPKNLQNVSKKALLSINLISLDKADLST